MMADDTDLQTACNALWKTREEILDCIKYELDLMNSFSSRMVAKLYFNKIALDKNHVSSAFNKGSEDEPLNVKISRINHIICRKIEEEIMKEEQESRRVAETYELLLNVSKFVFDKSANFYETGINNKKVDIDGTIIGMNNQSTETNAEALRRKLSWETWSGNQPLPGPHLFRFLKAHETTSSGPLISIPFKPVVWQRVIKQKSSEPIHSILKSESTADEAALRQEQNSLPRQVEKLLSINNQYYKQMDIASSAENEYCKNLSFGDFLTAIPALHLLSSGCMKALESASVHYVIPPSSEIIVRGQRCNEVYFVRRGVVNVTRPSDLNPLVEETVQYLGWGDIMCNAILLPDGSRSEDREAAANSNYSYSTAYAEVTMYTIPQEKFVQIIMDEIAGENSAVNAVSKAKKYLMIQNDLLNRSNRSDIAVSEFHLTAHMKFFSHVLQSLTVLESGVSELRAPVRSVMAVLLKLAGPELDFEEVVDELLQQCKLALQVDRVGLYVVDKILSTMILYVSQNITKGENSATNSPSSIRMSVGKSPPGSPSSTNVKRSSGIRMPLKGVAAHVALHGTPLVIADAYQNKHFDPSMDLRTGYRTKQMLSVPVCNHMGETVSVLQFINTLDGRVFSSNDLLIADMISRLLSTKAHLIKLRASLNGYKSLNKANEKFRFQILSAVTDKPHRHLKLSISLYVGTQQYGTTQRSDLFPTVAFNADPFDLNAAGFEGQSVGDSQRQGRISRCNFNTEVSFTSSSIFGGMKDVELAHLPQAGRIIIELFSKNSHPVSWTSINLFNFDRTFQSGAVETLLIDGPRPTSIMECISACCELQQSKLSQPERSKDLDASILSVAFPSFEAAQVVRDVDLSARYYNAVQAPLNILTGSGLTINSVEWYLLHMTPAEKKKYTTVVDSYAYQILFPVFDIDAETVQLLWRMRLALCTECTWALPLFLLSVDWLNADAVEEAYRLLYSWMRPSAAEVLQLLDGRFQDSRVRAYAVTVLSRVSDIQLLNVLSQLIYLLRFEPYSDSSLIRFIFRRAVGNPTVIGRKCCLYLLNTYAQDPVSCRSYASLLNILLRALPDSDRVHISHGWHFFRKVDDAFRECFADYMLVSSATTGGATSSIFSRKKTPERSKPPKSAVDSMIDRMIASRIPLEFCTSLSPRLCVGVEKYMALTDEGKKKTFAISLSVEKPASKSDKLRIIYSQDIDCTLEILYGQLLRAIEFVWEEEAVDIDACVYDSCVLDHNDAIFMEQPNDTATLNTLIVKALFPDNKPGNPAAKASQSNASKKIPDSLLLEYFSTRNLDEVSLAAAIETFKRSLAAFLVVTYVLSIFGVSASNTAVTADGRIYLKSPEYVLGLESHTSTYKRRKWKRNKEALFYLPCFARVFGSDDSGHHSEFHHLLSAAFLSVRKHSAFIVASITNLFALLHYSEDEQKHAMQLLKEALLPNVDDATALLKFMEYVNRGLNLDYQINVS